MSGAVGDEENVDGELVEGGDVRDGGNVTERSDLEGPSRELTTAALSREVEEDNVDGFEDLSSELAEVAMLELGPSLFSNDLNSYFAARA